MGVILAESVVILLLLLLNGVFAMSELALMTAKRSRLEHRADEEGDAGARVALELASHPTAFLSTVQVGITLVGILAGAFGGATIAELLAGQLAKVSWLAAYATSVSFALVVLVITYLSLIIGELVPKRIALGNPERVASLVARPMRALSRVGGPVVRVLTASTNFVFRIFGVRAVAAPGVTEQDIRALVEQGAESGAVQEAEREIVENTFRLGDRAVNAIMTPRPDVRWIDLQEEPALIRAQLTVHASSRFVVCEGELDRVVGIVHAEDLLARCLAGSADVSPASLREAARRPTFVPSTMPAFRLLETFRASGEQSAVVLDEYGTVAGLVTLDDLLEALVGELPAWADQTGPSMRRQADGSWLVDASTPLDDVANRLDLVVAEDDASEVVTLGGFVMARLGHLPREGDGFDWDGRRVQVMRMAGRRIEQVQISAPPRSGTPNASSPPGRVHEVS